MNVNIDRKLETLFKVSYQLALIVSDTCGDIRLQSNNICYNTYKIKLVTAWEQVLFFFFFAVRVQTELKTCHNSSIIKYKDRLSKLGLPTLVYRRLRGDMIEIFKILSNVIVKSWSLHMNMITEHSHLLPEVQEIKFPYVF